MDKWERRIINKLNIVRLEFLTRSVSFLRENVSFTEKDVRNLLTDFHPSPTFLTHFNV